MARGSGLGCLVVTALALCGMACKDKEPEAKPPPSGADLGTRCEQLAKLCGDKDKHVDKIVAECKQAATAQTAKGCTDKTVALYACYEKELCGKSDKVWAFGDLRVLAERKTKCAAEQAAAAGCMGQ